MNELKERNRRKEGRNLAGICFHELNSVYSRDALTGVPEKEGRKEKRKEGRRKEGRKEQRKEKRRM